MTRQARVAAFKTRRPDQVFQAISSWFGGPRRGFPARINHASTSSGPVKLTGWAPLPARESARLDLCECCPAR